MSRHTCLAALKVSPRSQPLQVKICESPSNTTTSPSANLDRDDFNQQKNVVFAKKNHLLFYAPPLSPLYFGGKCAESGYLCDSDKTFLIDAAQAKDLKKTAI